MQVIHTLFTSALCLALGAAVGRSMKNETQASESPPEAITKAPAASHAASLRAKPPPFTSSTASMEWIRAQMEKGDTTAAELFFRKDAGLTDEQRMALARQLVQNGRRMDPRVLARIVM
ncbi:MAG: hypothetical protein JNG86_04520, partial [Verrucomicrobiaceae bacterium]|nr:hypothetical protein [Verrucomicrobiaceae bacterium]